MKVSHAIALVCVAGAAGCQSRTASVLDIFPDSGVSRGTGSAVCSFDYEQSGSQWTSGIDEKQVFLASMTGDGWRLGIGKGGQIYSLRGPFGESVPPQRVESPWNDEVWQTVVTDESLIGPVQDYQNANRADWANIWNATFPMMYFVHQAGIYTAGAGADGGSVPAPFYSPCFRKRWDPQTRTLELVNWMQQARTPCVWKSGVLIYTAYRDLGDGVIEVNQVLHNFGSEMLSFMNIPWGGVRKSSLPQTIMSNPDGSWEVAGGTYGWTDIPTRWLVQTGGWQAWTQDSQKEDSPSLALVFGTDRENTSNGQRKDEAIRWGTAGEPERDYEVTERMTHAKAGPGGSQSIRWYLVVGEFSKVRKHAAECSKNAGVKPMDFDDSVKQPVWIQDGRVVTAGQGVPWVNLCAFPVKDTVPVFLLTDKRAGDQLITADPYALAETEPFPNPFPKELAIHGIYNNRVIYKQYLPYIHYENLLGYAFVKKSTTAMRPLELPPGMKNIRIHESAKNLWIKE